MLMRAIIYLSTYVNYVLPAIKLGLETLNLSVFLNVFVY